MDDKKEDNVRYLVNTKSQPSREARTGFEPRVSEEDLDQLEVNESIMEQAGRRSRISRENYSLLGNLIATICLSFLAAAFWWMMRRAQLQQLDAIEIAAQAGTDMTFSTLPGWYFFLFLACGAGAAMTFLTTSLCFTLRKRRG